jgi:hypothetical protein
MLVDQAAGCVDRPARRNLVTRVALLVISIVAGAALAFVLVFTVTSVLANVNETPVNQQLMNYGSR